MTQMSIGLMGLLYTLVGDENAFKNKEYEKTTI